MIASLISALCIVCDASSCILCRTEFLCSHILQVNSQSCSTVFLTHTSPLSLCSSRHQFADTAAPQCLLRYPCIARCQPICSCSDIAFSRSSHCISCTLLTSGITVSGYLSQDLMHFVNVSCTRQRSFCQIFFSIGRTRSYHFLWAPTCWHFRICS